MTCNCLKSLRSSFKYGRIFQHFSQRKIKTRKSSVNTQTALTHTFNMSSRHQALYLPSQQNQHLFALPHNSCNWPTQHKWYAQRRCVWLMFFIFPQSGYNIRVKALHFLNTKPWIDKLLAISKLALKSKLQSRVSVTAHFLSFSAQNLLFQRIIIYIHKMKLLVLLQSKYCKMYKYVHSNIILKI
jgi:hypothetical protein